MLAALIFAVMASAGPPTGEPVDQGAGARPNQDPDAIPDGKAVKSDKPQISFTLSAVSDYRFRGISQSSGHPAIQGSAEVTSGNGFYAGAWGSTIARYNGAHAEVDIYGGYRAAIANVNLDVGVISYLYPGGSDADGIELYATTTRQIGDTTLKVGGSYTPHQANFGSGDGSYLFAEVEQPAFQSFATIRGHIGREDGVGTPTDSRKIDWLLGIDVHPGPVILSVAWVDARYRERHGEADHDGRAVIAITKDF